MNGSTIISHGQHGNYGLSRPSFCRETLGVGAPSPSANTDVGFTFDSISRVLEEQQTYDLGLQFVTHNAWTSYPCTGFTFPSGRQLTIGFDALYRKNAINETAGSANIAAWQFFGARVATATLGNGMVTSFMNNAQTRSAIQSGQTTPAWGDITTDHVGYDGSGRLIGKRHWLPGGGTSPTTLVGFTTAYDPSSNKLFERTLHAESRSSLYTNDSMDRLTAYQRGILASGGATVTTPISLPGTDALRGYALDGLGNWLNTSYTPEGSSAQLELRTHNKLNQVLAFGVAPTSTPVLYDHGNNAGGNASRGNGNMVNDGTRAYVLDALNRVRTVSRTGGTGQYVYDALGRRVHIDRTITGGPTLHGKFLYDGQQIVEEIASAIATSMQYVWGQYIDELIQFNAVEAAGPNSLTGIYYLLSDLLYRSAALTDTSGTPQIVETYDTDAYGNTLLFSAAGTGGNWFADNATQAAYSACRFVFTGREYDPESGNYFYRARYYGPGLGRFIQRDPIAYDAGPNLYAGLRNGPIRYMDPYGRDPATQYTAPTPPSDLPTYSGGQAYGSPQKVDFSEGGVAFTGTVAITTGATVTGRGVVRPNSIVIDFKPNPYCYCRWMRFIARSLKNAPAAGYDAPTRFPDPNHPDINDVNHWRDGTVHRSYGVTYFDADRIDKLARYDVNIGFDSPDAGAPGTHVVADEYLFCGTPPGMKVQWHVHWEANTNDKGTLIYDTNSIISEAGGKLPPSVNGKYLIGQDDKGGDVMSIGVGTAFGK